MLYVTPSKETVQSYFFLFLLMGFIALQIYPQSVQVMCLLLTYLCTGVKIALMHVKQLFEEEEKD